MPSLGDRLATGSAWMLLFRLVVRGIGFVSTIILARLLLPADFGLVAMATALIAVIELLRSFSFDMALIQNQAADRRHYDTAFTLGVLTGGIIALALVALAEPAARFYSDPRLAAVINVLAISMAVQGFENVGVVAFRKDLELHQEFWFQVIKKLAAFGVTLVAALTLRNYWALVIGMVASSVIGVVLSYRMHPYRPRLSLAAGAEMLGFSKWLFLNNLTLVAYSRSADFIIGRLAGPAALGVYSLGYEIGNLTATDLVAPINRAIFPGYARLAHDREQLRQGFLRTIGVIALLGLPAGVGIALGAEPLVLLLLGEKWQACIPVVQVMGLYGSVVALNSNIGTLMIALGRPRLLTALSAAHVAVLLPLLFFGAARAGSLGAAAAVLGAQLLHLPLIYLVLRHWLGIGPADYRGFLLRPVVATGVMTAGVLAVGPLLTALWAEPPHLAVLLVTVVTGLATYLAAAAAAWHLAGRPAGAERTLLDRVPALAAGVIR